MNLLNPARFFLFSRILTLSAVLTACAPDSPHTSSNPGTEPLSDDSSIVHGKNVKEKSELSRSVVALVSTRQDGQAVCTGTILAEDMVLTAAHCVEGQPQKISVVFGNQVHLAKPESIRNVESFIQNPLWHHPSEKGQGDLAIVHFLGKLPTGYQAVKLASDDFKLFSGQEVQIIGYGVTNGLSHLGAGVLRQAQTTVIGQKTKSEIITDGRLSSVCFGDSGGPAFTQVDGNFTQWGIASSVKNQACNQSSVHTAVMGYKKWILASMQKLRKFGK